MADFGLARCLGMDKTHLSTVPQACKLLKTLVTSCVRLIKKEIHTMLLIEFTNSHCKARVYTIKFWTPRWILIEENQEMRWRGSKA